MASMNRTHIAPMWAMTRRAIFMAGSSRLSFESVIPAAPPQPLILNPQLQYRCWAYSVKPGHLELRIVLRCDRGPLGSRTHRNGGSAMFNLRSLDLNLL